MIPILFEKNTSSFTTQGLGRLADCISCIVTEERNGIYECQFEYPISGVMYKELTLGRIIVCTHDDRKDFQPFIIYARSVPDVRGIVQFSAHHISYMLNDIVVKPFTATSCADALQKIKSQSVNNNPFNFWTDKTTVADFKSEIPRAARNMLGGEENSILDVYGSGEYEFNGFDVKLYAHRGQDSGVAIRYGKNLINLSQNIDDSSCYNAIVPYWADTEGNVSTLPEMIISFAPQGERVDAAPMDLSSDFETAPTAAELRSRARAKYQSGDSWLPAENITVDFVQLWQTEEYKDFTGLQRVSLCDTVSVYYEPAGVEAVKQKVVKTVYNVLLDRYDQIELGELQTSLGHAIRENILEEVPTTSMMEQAIQYATELIRGGLGGYVVMTPGANGYPQEILIMDTPDVNTAVNVWRFNKGGLGHSHNGYNGPYSDIALTSDGRINATMITTGILNANIIKAGILSDYNGNTSFNLSTGLFTMKRGSINLGNGKFQAKDNGELITQFGTIGPYNFTSSKLYRDSNGAYFRIGYYGMWVGDTYAGGDRLAMYIHPQAIEYHKGNSETEWESLPEISSINWYNDGTTISIEFENAQSYRAALSLREEDANFNNKTSVYTTNLWVTGDLRVSGNKSRKARTDNYSDRLLYCYETPTPLFGDIGEAVLDEEGICYVDIDDIFTETIAGKAEYQVFLQKEGDGDCWIKEKNAGYFVIEGTPHLKVAWELKAKQRDYENIRLEMSENGLEEYATYTDPLLNVDEYIREQEELLYGYN